MSKKKSLVEKNSTLLAFALQVVGVLMVVLNLWLANKLAPLARDVDVLKVKISAIEITHEKDTSKIEGYFLRLEDKIDRINERL